LPVRHTSTLFAVALIALLGSTSAAADPTELCDLRLKVQLTPDVPNPRDPGFLSSLLGNHSGYQLTLQRQRGDFVIDLELEGSGADDGCRNVVEALRRDGRVVFIQVQQQRSQ
jgi:hypothetical protein